MTPSPAHSRESRRNHRRKPLIKLLAGVFLMGAIVGGGVVYWYGPAWLPTRECQPETTPVQAADALPATRQAGDFEFYSKLEKAPVAEVEVATQEAPPTVPVVASASTKAKPNPATETQATAAQSLLPAPVSVPGPFFLQVASFARQEEADALQARLSLAGVPASVVNVELPDHGIRYRVRVGPYTSKDEAVAARTQLAAEHAEVAQAFLTR